ncbi:MAG: hypothetical protein LAC69_00445 [Chlorobium sp.]|nr:hypothetical protein [Chlorobium sp.]
MTSQQKNPFIFSQTTFLESKKFVLPQIPVEITIQLHKVSGKANSEYFISSSHFLKTPLPSTAPLVNQFDQTIVYRAVDNEKAFETIKRSFFHAYEGAKNRCLMPDNSWLIPNSEFMEFNNTKVQ